MKDISNELAGHIAGEVTQLATCWRVIRRDGVVLGFTTHDRALTVDGLAYQPQGGFMPSAVAATASLNVDDAEVEGALSSPGLDPAALRAGRFDFARVEIFRVNWADTSQGKLHLRTGWLGEVRLRDHVFTAELRGLTQALQADLGDVYSPECRADLGDMQCKVDLSQFTVRGTVDSSAAPDSFMDAARMEADGYFAYGLLVWANGANAGLFAEVKGFASGAFTLAQAMPTAIVPGDEYRVQAGCDRRFGTCKERFNNAVNFRGEPFVPGTDAILEYPGIR